MIEIKSNKSLEQVYRILENNLTELSFFNFYQLGYLGSVDRETGRVRIVDHVNTLIPQSNYRYRTLRTFVGSITQDHEGVIIKGRYRLQLLAKLQFGLFITPSLLMLAVFLLAPEPFIVKLKVSLIALAIIFLCLFACYTVFRTCKKYEPMLIQHVSELLNQ